MCQHMRWATYSRPFRVTTGWLVCELSYAGPDNGSFQHWNAKYGWRIVTVWNRRYRAWKDSLSHAALDVTNNADFIEIGNWNCLEICKRSIQTLSILRRLMYLNIYDCTLFSKIDEWSMTPDNVNRHKCFCVIGIAWIRSLCSRIHIHIWLTLIMLKC